MAATGAKKGAGTLFERETVVGGGAYATVAEVKSIGGPSLSRGQVEATHMESPNDHEEWMASMASGGEIALVLNLRPDHASQGTTAGLLKDFQDATVRGWRISWPQFTNTPRLAFNGFITGWEPSSAPKEILTVAVKIKITGPVTASSFA